MQRIEMPSIPAVQKHNNGAIDYITLFDSMTDLAVTASGMRKARTLGYREASGFTGGMSTDEAIEALAVGDEAAADSSDKLMQRLERFLQIKASRFKIVDDVAGVVPNVPAYLAGQPLAMRRRQRIADELAPLTVVACATSSGMVSVSDLRNRGAAILAFVRAMTAVRPVRLFVSVTTGYARDKNAYRMIVPVETSPLDVTRAAYLLSNQGYARALGMRMAVEAVGKEFNDYVPWPYDSITLERATQAATYEHILGGEVFNITGAYGGDKALDKPAEWLEEHLAKYGIRQE